MRVAFELDDVLIAQRSILDVEWPQAVLPKRRPRYPLRTGTMALFEKMRAHNIEIWIYTQAFRRRLAVRRLFKRYDIALDGVINQTTHRRRLRQLPQNFSKYPPAFGIDLLIDHAEAVVQEGADAGFNVLQINPADKAWTLKVWQEIRYIAHLQGLSLPK